MRPHTISIFTIDRKELIASIDHAPDTFFDIMTNDAPLPTPRGCLVALILVCAAAALLNVGLFVAALTNNLKSLSENPVARFLLCTAIIVGSTTVGAVICYTVLKLEPRREWRFWFKLLFGLLLVIAGLYAIYFLVVLSHT